MRALDFKLFTRVKIKVEQLKLKDRMENVVFFSVEIETKSFIFIHETHE